MQEVNNGKARKKRYAPHLPVRRTGEVNRNPAHEVPAPKETRTNAAVINNVVRGSSSSELESAFSVSQDSLNNELHSERNINDTKRPNISDPKYVQVPQLKSENEQMQRIKNDKRRKHAPKSVKESSYNLRHIRQAVEVPPDEASRSDAANKGPLELFSNPVLAPKIKNLINETRILDLEPRRQAVRLSLTNTTQSAALLPGDKNSLHHHHHLPGHFHNRGHNHAIKRAARKQAIRARQFAAIASFFGARTRLDQGQKLFPRLDSDTTNADGSTTSQPSSTSGPGVSVPGVLLACVSVVFIIIGIAFVYSRLRKSKPTAEQDQPDLEMRSPDEDKDPYMEWLNMPEEPLPPPALGKQVKTAVRTVSRKMSLTPKPPTDDFKPGVPPHLRYQLKEIYVY